MLNPISEAELVALKEPILIHSAFGEVTVDIPESRVILPLVYDKIVLSQSHRLQHECFGARGGWFEATFSLVHSEVSSFQGCSNSFLQKLL